MRRPGCGGGELQAWRAQPGRTKSLCILQGGRVQFALDRQPAGQRRARLRDREESEAKRNMRPSSSGGGEAGRAGKGPDRPQSRSPGASPAGSSQSLDGMLLAFGVSHGSGMLLKPPRS